jgi:hypothetical protein
MELNDRSSIEGQSIEYDLSSKNASDEMTPYELYKFNQTSKNTPKPFPKWLAWLAIILGCFFIFSVIKDLT